MTYELITDDISGKEVIKYIREDGKEFWIPTDLGNSDYQAYLAWLENPEAAQSTPSVE